MLRYKTIDFWGQVLAILGALAGYFLDQSGALLSISLITLALLQLVSLLVHATAGFLPWKSKLRKWHTVATILVLLVMVYGMLKPGEDKYDFSGLGIMIRALVPAAIVALFYTLISGMEWKVLRALKKA
jgi:hypothetical protein